MTIDEKLDKLLAMVANIEKRVAGLTVRQAAKASAVDAADDRDLDGQHGNPVVRKDPPRWEGDSFVGCKFSECSPEYLDAVASFKLWQAQKDEASGDEERAKKARFARKDAARAVGWAQRLRNGYQPPAPDDFGGNVDDVPFA